MYLFYFFVNYKRVLVEIVVKHERICAMHIIVFVFQYDERDTNMYLNCVRMNIDCLPNNRVFME